MRLDDVKTMIYRYYQDLWNAGKLEAADTLLAEDVTIRGSLGVTVRGTEGFRTYLQMVRTALPDLRIDVEELITQGDRVAARIRHVGTHRGPLYGVAPTGRPVDYDGVTLFRVADGRITDVWALGDTLHLLTQVGAFPDLPMN